VFGHVNDRRASDHARILLAAPYAWLIGIGG